MPPLTAEDRHDGAAEMRRMPADVVAMLPGGGPRGGTVGGQIARAISQALDACGLSREEVAARMSEILGATVSKNMLDAYASQARSETHRITVERLIALIHATGQVGLVGFLAEAFGLIAVPERYGELIELHHVEEELAALEARRDRLGARWKGVRS